MKQPAPRTAGDPGLPPQPVGPGSAALALLTSALWGGTPVAISFSVDTLPPVAVAAIRFLLAAAFMYCWCRAQRASLRLRPGQGRPAVIAGVLLFLQISLFHVGVEASNSSRGSMFINTFIFWVVALEHLVTRTDRISLRKLAGMSIAALGVVLILSKSQRPDAASVALDPPTLAGDVVLLLSAALLGVKIVYTKHALRTVEPGKLIFWHDLVGVVLLAACSLAMEDTSGIRLADFTLPAVLGLLYQGLFVAGFCFAIQALLLRRHSASQISVFSFSTPLFGVAIAVLMRGDPLSPFLLASALCVAGGILLVNLR